MNKKVYIKQDGTIPGHRIIKELERRGGINEYKNIGLGDSGIYYYISFSSVIIYSNSMDAAPIELLIEQGYTELLYNKEADSFYENSPVLSNSSNIGKLLEGEYEIPKGYEITVGDGKVIVKKKKWQPKKGEIVWTMDFEFDDFCFVPTTQLWDDDFMLRYSDFPTAEEAQAFCDKLNATLKPIIDERRKEVDNE